MEMKTNGPFCIRVLMLVGGVDLMDVRQTIYLLTSRRCTVHRKRHLSEANLALGDLVE